MRISTPELPPSQQAVILLQISHTQSLSSRLGGGLRNTFVLAKLLTNMPTNSIKRLPAPGDTSDGCVVQCVASNVCWGTNHPRYSFTCSTRVGLSAQFMLRLQNGRIVLEVWDKMRYVVNEFLCCLSHVLCFFVLCCDV